MLAVAQSRQSRPFISLTFRHVGTKHDASLRPLGKGANCRVTARKGRTRRAYVVAERLSARGHAWGPPAAQAPHTRVAIRYKCRVTICAARRRPPGAGRGRRPRRSGHVTTCRHAIRACRWPCATVGGRTEPLSPSSAALIFFRHEEIRCGTGVATGPRYPCHSSRLLSPCNPNAPLVRRALGSSS